MTTIGIVEVLDTNDVFEPAMFSLVSKLQEAVEFVVACASGVVLVAAVAASPALPIGAQHQAGTAVHLIEAEAIIEHRSAAFERDYGLDDDGMRRAWASAEALLRARGIDPSTVGSGRISALRGHPGMAWEDDEV